jgi:hypothetical protein
LSWTVLSWTPAASDTTVRIHRKLIEKPGIEKPGTEKPGTEKPGTEKPSAQKSSASLEQTLEFSGADQGRVLDRDAALDHTYTYTAQRIAKLELQGQAIEIASSSSASVNIDARDLFPPATPQGLQAVADPEAHAIDLSWQPDTEADLAGYSVYRREAGSSAQPERVSPPAQPPASFRDMNVLPGHTYDYSVSAVDRDGNESPRSGDVEESLPQQ